MLKKPSAFAVGLTALCMSFGGGDAAAQGTDVTIALVPRAVSSPDDIAAVLPEAETVLPVGGIVVEVWAQTLALDGLAQASVDFGFASGAFTVTSVTHTPVFSLFAVHTIDNTNGIVDDLSGAVPPALPACSAKVGAAPQWARLAIIGLEANTIGVSDFTVGPTNNLVFVNANCGLLDAPTVTFLGASVTVESSGPLVPSASSWGLLTLALLLLTVGTTRIRRTRALRAAA